MWETDEKRQMFFFSIHVHIYFTLISLLKKYLTMPDIILLVVFLRI